MAEPVVLVPLDGSSDALCALPIARRLAETRKASLHILHVTGGTSSPDVSVASLGLQTADLAGGTLEVRRGRPAEAIPAAAEDHAASLIVMAAHVALAGPEGAMGPTPRAVISEARCPVVLVNPQWNRDGWALRRVLAPHDGSPAVSGALRPATELARQADADLIVLHVADEGGVLETGSLASPAYMDQVQHSWPAWSAEFLHRLASAAPLSDVRIDLRVCHGQISAETIRLAAEESADLIILALKGRWEARFASILTDLLRGAPCPIMVTRNPGSPDG